MSTVVPDASAAREALAGVVAGGEQMLSDEHVRETYARVVWSTLVEPGDGVAGVLVDSLGALAALDVALTDARLSAHVDVDLDADALRAGRGRWMPRRDAVAGALERARRAEVKIITPDHPHWPTGSADLGPHGPICLWTRGDTRLLSTAQHGVALVGARASTTYGDVIAAELAAECAAGSITVFSGGAYGIDGAAHRAALSADGATVAVMAGGVDRPYPAGHRDMLERIARAGLVVAEVPCGTAPSKHRFLARNRLIAAFSDATVVVEAGWRSGAQNTAHHAHAIGRPVGVVPGPITSAASMGCHRLLREGDAICVTCFADVRDLFEDAARGVDAATSPGGYTGDRTRILDALTARSPRSVVDVAQRAGCSLADAQALLGMMELDGAVRRTEVGWVQERGASPSRLW